MFTLYNVISSDGFIARKDGSEDFIPDNLWGNFLDLCVKYGTLVMGRKTYNTIQRYEKEPVRLLEELPIKKIVISGDSDFRPKEGYVVVRSPEEAFAIAPDGLVSSGPTLNNFLLKNGLVGKIILHEVPEAIGEGIRPFDDDIAVVPTQSSSRLAGVKVREYDVEN